MSLWLDIDGVLVNFLAALEKCAGINLAPDDWDRFHWHNDGHCEACGGACKFPTAEQLYAVAELQPWATELIINAQLLVWPSNVKYITKDYPELKRKVLFCLGGCNCGDDAKIIEAVDKSEYCNFADVLIDDCRANCLAWEAKGGTAYWFNLASENPYGDFCEWYRNFRIMIQGVK